MRRSRNIGWLLFALLAVACNPTGIGWNLPRFAVLQTAVPTGILNLSAVSGGKITDDGGSPVQERGVCYSKNTNPVIADSLVSCGSGSGDFSAHLTGLEASTTYFIRAYATTKAGTAYGNETTVTTLNYAALETKAISLVTLTTALCGGSVTDGGGATVSERGICYSDTKNPTTSNVKIAAGSGVGDFDVTLNGLTPNSTYYVRAYAINLIGTVYGNEVAFTTASLPTLSTAAITLITQTSARSGGDITNGGSSAVQVRGICYDINSNPTIANFVVTGGSGSGNFALSLSGLIPGTTYYVKAFATNGAGTSYGNEISFTTNPVVLPSLITTTVTAVTRISAVSGGNVTNNGGGVLISKGICYGTSHNPTIDQNTVEKGTATGSFSADLTGLTPGTIYFVRAFATNSAGTSYGNELSFTTSPVVLATLLTTVASAVLTTSATSGGIITNDGGGAILSKGVCYGTSHNPTLSQNVVENGTGTGSFNADLTGLNSATTYYLRAFATNSAGTAYGNEINFTTLPILKIGQTYQGGLIFYLDATNFHGLIAASGDQSTSAAWGCAGILIAGSENLAVGTGMSNTTAILTECSTTGIAAKICGDLVQGGYSDWFLPSLDELNLMYNNLKLQGLGNFAAANYWSSTEFSGTNSYFNSFSNGVNGSTLKSNSNRVRAIRTF